MTCPDIFLNDLFLFQGRVSKIFVFIVPLWDGICFLGEGFCHYPWEKKLFPLKYFCNWPYVVETLPWLPSAFDGWWFFPRWILPTAFGGWKLFPSVYFLRNFSLMKYRLNGRIFTPAIWMHCTSHSFLKWQPQKTFIFVVLLVFFGFGLWIPLRQFWSFPLGTGSRSSASAYQNGTIHHFSPGMLTLSGPCYGLSMILIFFGKPKSWNKTARKLSNQVIN